MVGISELRKMPGALMKAPDEAFVITHANDYQRGFGRQSRVSDESGIVETELRGSFTGRRRADRHRLDYQNGTCSACIISAPASSGSRKPRRTSDQTDCSYSPR